MIKLLVFSLLALNAANALAGTMYIYKDKAGEVRITNVNPDVNAEKFTKKVKTTYYKDTGKETINPLPQKYSESEKNKRSKDTYVQVVQQPKSNTTNNVAKFYKPLEWTQSQKQGFEYRKGLEEVRVIESNDLEKSFNSLVAKGYSVLGSSGFVDRELPHSIFKSQAIKIGAETVVIYKQGISSVSYHVDDDLNNLDYAYQYQADFYVKNNSYKQPNMMGISMTEIPLDKRKLYQRNTGVYVANVIKDARAYFANVVVEDVIIAVNGKEVRSTEDLDRIKESELKTTKNLNLTIIRLINNEPKEIQILVNFN